MDPAGILILLYDASCTPDAALPTFPLPREGVRATLAREPSVILVGEGSAGEHLEPLLARHRPDVVLLDLCMPQREGETTRDGQPFQPQAAVTRMAAAYPKTRFVILSNDCTRGHLSDDSRLQADGATCQTSYHLRVRRSSNPRSQVTPVFGPRKQ